MNMSPSATFHVRWRFYAASSLALTSLLCKHYFLLPVSGGSSSSLDFGPVSAELFHNICNSENTENVMNGRKAFCGK